MPPSELPAEATMTHTMGSNPPITMAARTASELMGKIVDARNEPRNSPP